MRFLVNVTLEFLNLGMFIGATVGVLFLLRPLLVRVLSPQKRALLWLVVWWPAYLPTLYGATNHFLGKWIPFTFRTLLSPRTGGSFDVPAYLPSYYRGTGQYNLALPGGKLHQVELREEWLTLMAVVWLLGAVCMLLYCWYLNRRLMSRARQGEVLAWNSPMIKCLSEKEREHTIVRICTGLPTSFVRSAAENYNGVEYRSAVYLQKELPPEQMALVLRHELQHLRLNHCGWKMYANIGLVLYWWNPMIWLGYRYFCRDLELACDQAVLEQLTREERRDYARALVEIGSGRQLWEAPLSFGECDAQLRVKAVVGWKKPASKWSIKNLAATAFTVGLMLFFLVGPEGVYRQEDRTLAWQQEIVYDEVAEFSPSSYYREDDAPTLALTEIWMRAEDAEDSNEWMYATEIYPMGTSPWIYGKAEDGSWWRFQLHWKESRGEYQMCFASQATDFEERLNGPEEFVQIK